MTPLNNLQTFDPREQAQDNDQVQYAGTQQQAYTFNEDAENEYMQEGDLNEEEQPGSDEL